MKSLEVNLGDHSYPIYIEKDGNTLSSFLCPQIKGKRVVVVSNTTVLPIFKPQIENALTDFDVSYYAMPDGEAYKTLDTYHDIMTFLLEQGAARDVTLIALGGGVVGDICGFVAATFMRGVDFIQVPTTLLSQVDSSVGGKTAVNHPLGKNMIGAFYQPQAVYIGMDSLASLPKREFAAGMAEVVKYGILADADLFEYLEKNVSAIQQMDDDVMAYVIHRCCAIKAEIVAEDEKEQGRRALLNLGHTFGHAIEAEQGFGVWLHGEAVAAGMVQACQLAKLRGWVSDSDVNRVVALLKAFDLPTSGPSTMSCDDYIKHMKKDKKVKASTIRFILPKQLGQAILVSDVTESELQTIL